MTKNEIKIPTSNPPILDSRELLEQSKKLAQTGRSVDALSVLDQAETSVRSNKSLSPFERDLALSRIHINRGITLKNMRSLEKSAHCYELAKKLLKDYENEAPREIFSAELNLAVLKTRLKNRKDALKGFDRAELIAGKFMEPERRELIWKVLTNKAQLHLEFHELDKARELLGKLAADHDRHSKNGNIERNARVSAQLGLLIVHLAEKEDNQKLAKEHFQKAVHFFDEAIRIYNSLGLTRDALCQTINKAEVLISLSRHQEAMDLLQNVYNEAVEKSANTIMASASLKLLAIAVHNSNNEEKDKWLSVSLDCAKAMNPEARSDFLERLESHLRWTGGDELITRVQKQRERDSVN